jgi:hypothetical protein
MAPLAVPNPGPEFLRGMELGVPQVVHDIAQGSVFGV